MERGLGKAARPASNVKLLLFGARTLYVGIAMLVATTVATVSCDTYFVVVDDPVPKSLQNLCSLAVGVSLLFLFVAAVTLCIATSRLGPSARRAPRDHEAESTV